jgi:hypothetical protein
MAEILAKSYNVSSHFFFQKRWVDDISSTLDKKKKTQARGPYQNRSGPTTPDLMLFILKNYSFLFIFKLI